MSTPSLLAVILMSLAVVPPAPYGPAGERDRRQAKIRLRVTQARVCPAIAELAVFAEIQSSTPHPSPPHLGGGGR